MPPPSCSAARVPPPPLGGKRGERSGGEEEEVVAVALALAPRRSLLRATERKERGEEVGRVVGDMSGRTGRGEEWSGVRVRGEGKGVGIFRGIFACM